MNDHRGKPSNVGSKQAVLLRKSLRHCPVDSTGFENLNQNESLV
jgi:hypothetical protein